MSAYWEVSGNQAHLLSPVATVKNVSCLAVRLLTFSSSENMLVYVHRFTRDVYDPNTNRTTLPADMYMGYYIVYGTEQIGLVTLPVGIYRVLLTATARSLKNVAIRTIALTEGRCRKYTWDSCNIGYMPERVGFTKASFVDFSVSKIFDLAKVPLKLFKWHLCVKGATANELRRHLSHINVSFNS